MNKEFIIFGASTGGVKVYKMLESLGIVCSYFVDNAMSKWGDILEEKEIKSPDSLKMNNLLILIASVYQEEIEKQLIGMGIELSRIITREQLIREKLDGNMSQYKNKLQLSHVNKERTFIIDLDHGLEVGGIESWSYLLAQTALEQEKQVTIYTNSDNVEAPFGVDHSIKHMDLSKKDVELEILNIAADMIDKLPCIFIANWMEHSFWAAYILKNLFPDQVFIHGIVHHDMLCYYRRNQYLEDIVDSFLCVSRDTQIRMIEEFQIYKNKVCYKEVPIRPNFDFSRKKNIEDALVIGLGSRLDKAKKRVDLVMPLIHYLRKENFAFQLRIAGDGSYYEKLRQFIQDNGFEEAVVLLGEIKPEKMGDFWKKCDVVVSTSDSEGMGLSVLEAMSYGVVPVVTNTAGMKYFVINGQSGYIVPINDINKMAEHISYLNKDREKLYGMNVNAKNLIKNKCSPGDYLAYIENMTMKNT